MKPFIDRARALHLEGSQINPWHHHLKILWWKVLGNTPYPLLGETDHNVQDGPKV